MQALQGSANLPGKVQGHRRHRVKGAPLRVEHIQPPKQLETAQLLTITCTGRLPLARTIKILQPAVIARNVVMQHMMHRACQDIVQQTMCYGSLPQSCGRWTNQPGERGFGQQAGGSVRLRAARDTSTIKPSVQMQMHHNCSSLVEKALLICIKKWGHALAHHDNEVVDKVP